MFIIIILIHILILTETNTTQSTEELIQQLALIDKKISNIFNLHNIKQKSISMFKFSQHYFNNVNFKNKGQYLVPSVSFTDKKSNFYSFLLQNRISENTTAYYTMDANIVYQIQNKSHFYKGYRIESSIFVQQSIIQDDINLYQYKISSLRFINKKAQITVDMVFNCSYMKSISSPKFLFLTDNGQIDVYHKSGQIYSQICLNETTSENLKLELLNNQILVFSSTKIWKINFFRDKQYQIIKCQFYEQGILQIKYDDSNYNKFYARNSKKIFVYEISQKQCKLIQHYNIQYNGQFYPLGQLIYIVQVQSNLLYYINTTNHMLQYFQIPFPRCQQYKIEFIKKKNNNYVMGHFCKQKFNQTGLFVEYFSIQLEERSIVGDIDFSKLRIIFILLSVGLVIYISYKKKNNSNPIERQLNTIDSDQQKLELLKKIKKL